MNDDRITIKCKLNKSDSISFSTHKGLGGVLIQMEGAGFQSCVDISKKKMEELRAWLNKQLDGNGKKDISEQ